MEIIFMGFRFTTNKQSQEMPVNIDPSLSEAISRLKSYIHFKRKKSGDDKEVKEIKGGVSTIRIQKYPISRQLYDSANFVQLGTTETNIKVAISTPTKFDKTKLTPAQIEEIIQTQKEQLQATKTAMKLLSELEKKDNGNNKQPTLFIHHYLYHGEDGKVSDAADCDLLDWMIAKKDTISEEKLKEIIAQIVLAVNEFHSDELVHRDIKFENFLVFESGDHTHIKLADPEGIIKASQKTPTICFTRGYFAPEALRAFENNFYSAIPKKPVDCYAVGWMIGTILEDAIKNNPEITTPYKEKLDTLYQNLTHKENWLRYTIKQAMSHDFFGNNEKERIEYFSKIIEKYTPHVDVYIDTYYYNPKSDFFPPFGAAFFLLEAPFKEIYLQAVSLENQITLVQHHYCSLEPEHITAIKNRINKLEHLIEENLALAKEKNYKLYFILEDLQTAINKTKELISTTEKNFTVNSTRYKRMNQFFKVRFKNPLPQAEEKKLETRGIHFKLKLR